MQTVSHPILAEKPASRKEKAIQTTTERGNAFAVATQEKALTTAIEAGPAALLGYAQELNARYAARAKEQAGNYRLLFIPGYRWAQGVVKISDGVPYLQEQNRDGEAVCMCGQEGYIERVNEALRGAGFCYRVYDKHYFILHLLEKTRTVADVYQTIREEEAIA